MSSRSRTANIALAAAFFLANTVCSTLSAQAADWPVQRLHAPTFSLSRLAPADQSIAMKLLRTELGPLFQGDATSVVDQQIRSFRAERINLGGVPAVALSPSWGELCAANGNCSFWIIDLLHRRTLLRAEAVDKFAIETAKPHTTPDVVTMTRSSGEQSEMIRWHFTSTYYERENCATLDNAGDNGASLTPPKITSHPCSPEGN